MPVCFAVSPFRCCGAAVLYCFVQVMRRKGNLGALSGADGSRYMEYDSKPPKKHPLFKSRFLKLKN